MESKSARVKRRGGKTKVKKRENSCKTRHLKNDHKATKSSINFIVSSSTMAKFEKYFQYGLDLACDTIRILLDLPIFFWILASSLTCATVQALLPRKRKSLDNQTILVTGAAAGIGREAAVQLAKVSNKATFVLWDINEKGLREVSEECRKLGATVFYYVVDLSQRDHVVQTAALVRKEVGDITILFNNAGFLQYDAFLDASPVLEQKILEVNLLSYMWIIREFLPAMVEKGTGHIVNTCSGLAHLRFRYLSSYVASKYGLKGFLECLKLEMRIHPNKPDIKFSTVYPGWVKTNMTGAVTWEPRYKTWQFMNQLDPEYVTERIVDGILKEKEEIMVPGSIFLMKYFYSFIPTRLMDRMENFLYKNIKMERSFTNVVLKSSPDPTPKQNDNACSITISPNPPSTVVLLPDQVDELEHLNSENAKTIQ